MVKTYNVFISHSWSHIDDLKNLRSLLESRGYFNVEFQEASPNEPINSSNAYYIKQRLKTKIVNSNVILALAGIYATHSDWMTWELETAYNNSIPIIGVIPRGQERISSTVNTYSKINVKWNTESIVEKIRIYAN
jgi:uncharacterized protein YdaL